MLTPMLGPVGPMVHPQPTKTVKQIPFVCTCGARTFHEERRRLKSSQQQQPEHATTEQAKRDANPTDVDMEDAPVAKRSLWRKLLGVGPKCTCPKFVEPSKLLEIPSEYVGCSVVVVSGKRVPFSREMQHKQRASWNPLDAIEEDE